MDKRWIILQAFSERADHLKIHTHNLHTLYLSPTPPFCNNVGLIFQAACNKVQAILFRPKLEALGTSNFDPDVPRNGQNGPKKSVLDYQNHHLTPFWSTFGPPCAKIGGTPLFQIGPKTLPWTSSNPSHLSDHKNRQIAILSVFGQFE